MTEFIGSDGSPLYTCKLCWSTVLANNIPRHRAFHTEWLTWMNSVRENFDAINTSFEGVEKAIEKLAKR